MPVGKYIEIDAGKLKEVQAINESVGAADADKIVRTHATGKLHDTLMPEGIGAETVVCPTSEALLANDVCNFWSDVGVLKVRKAIATDDTKPAHGYVKAGFALGANATVYLDAFLPGTGYTIGSVYFLSTTAGGVTTTCPTGAGNIRQVVGFACNTDKIKFEPGDIIVRL